MLHYTLNTGHTRESPRSEVAADIPTILAPLLASGDIRKAAQSLVNEWQQYLDGDVWGYQIIDEDGEHVDSCWGFYGEKYCREEAESVLASLQSSESANELATNAMMRL